MLQRGLNQGGRVLQGDFDEIRWVGTGDVSHLSIERGLHECRIDRFSGARVLKREMTARPGCIELVERGPLSTGQRHIPF